jgi:hypothetical protein
MKNIKGALMGVLITAGVATVLASPAHADPYQELGPTICMAARHGETIQELADTMVRVVNADPGPKGPITHDQGVSVVTVMINAYCPELLLSASGR